MNCSIIQLRSLNPVKYGHAIFFKEKFESTNSLSMKPKWSNFKTLSLICTKKTFSFDLNIMHALGAVDIKIYSISAQSYEFCPHLRKLDILDFTLSRHQWLVLAPQRAGLEHLRTTPLVAKLFCFHQPKINLAWPNILSDDVIHTHKFVNKVSNKATLYSTARGNGWQ